MTANSASPGQEDLIRAGALLSGESDFKSLVSVLVEQTQDIVRSDLAAFYLFRDSGDLRLMYKRGRRAAPERFSGNGELIPFLRECGEAALCNGGGDGFLRETLLAESMQSGAALPLRGPSGDIGVLFVNSATRLFFNRSRFYFLDSFTKLAGGIMQTSRLFSEMKEYLAKIEAMERYQESIFNSMTNMIIAVDAEGRIHYFNRAAMEAMGLGDDAIGRSMDETFRGSLSARTLRTITESSSGRREILGLEGIYRREGRELDYSLNITPLETRRGRSEGMTLLFTDQTREKELKGRISAVTEERRIIKDMFCRYMSSEVLTNLMEYPERIRPGGDKKNATVFFADIRGYTSFSEGREPGEIIDILNGYFGEAVEHVVKHRGYIDKFIGDCIMAVWGVPLESEEDDAVNAVSCALEIQQLVKSSRRRFFLKEAARLKIGIGINSGPLVAGNLGSLRRMDYSVIGDTVNLASRLEGIAGAGEIIISRATREKTGDRFRLEKRPDVMVKGKDRPVEIYRVLGYA
ncbi:MAG: PAS domain S-box protein [Treponema sp.]|jgi:PAS domain S-box-containing protein|nr:PAS domain S-box protein [Treponema sp.]